MRINSGISMPGKMLPCGQDARLLSSTNKGGTQAGYQFCIFPKGTNINDWIGGVIIHI